jgi:hypothetical protein
MDLLGAYGSTILDIERFGSNSTLSDNVGIEFLVASSGALSVGFGDGASWDPLYTGSSDAYSSTGPAISTGAWTHVAASRQNNSVRFYVDGNFIDAVACQSTDIDFSCTSSREDDRTNLGRNYQLKLDGTENNIHHFDGRIAEVGVWNRQLLDSEIGQVAQAVPAGSSLSDLQAFWPLQDGSGPATETVGNLGTGTLEGAQWSDTCD